jgi:YbbR domain-containing protein
MAISLLASLLLWVYVTESEGENIERSFPGVQVRFDGESTMRDTREMIVSDDSTTSVKVTLTGSRRALSALSSADLSAVIDLSRITRTGNYQLAPTISFPSRTDTSAIASIVIDPDSVSFYVDKLDKKTLEVRGVFNGSTAEGYSADPLSFSPSTVIVYGPGKVLDTVDAAYVEVNRTDVDRTLSFDSTFVLLDAEGNEVESDALSYNTEQVNVTLPVRAVKEVYLTVELVPGGGATEKNVRWSLEPGSITLLGDAEVLSGVNSITVARIELAQVEDAMQETYRVELPNDTELIVGARETTLTLELQDLETAYYTIDKSNISFINVSEGYTALAEDSLDKVRIRGSHAVLEQLSDLNIRAVADLKNYGTATGRFTVPVQISINGASASEVGAVGNYEIVAILSEATEEEGER